MSKANLHPCLSLYLFDKCCTQKDHHSSGIKYAMEGYIKDFIINMVGINLEARVYRLVVTIIEKKIVYQHCSCIAGYD